RVLLLTSTLPPCSTLFPYTTLFRSPFIHYSNEIHDARDTPPPPGYSLKFYHFQSFTMNSVPASGALSTSIVPPSISTVSWTIARSEEHTSELQSRFDLVCRLLLEKK